MTSRFRAIIGVVCLLLVVLALSVGEVDAQTPSTVRALSYTRHVLPNGLVVLFNEDHSSPVIGAVAWYHIGAKDEPDGQAGYAHLCEHMMFEGSPNVPPGQFQAIVRAGGATSARTAETSEDRTYFYQTIPSNQLETWLWLESDRMAAPFSAMDSSRLDKVRDVVKRERQQSRENAPFGFAGTVTLGALYGGARPYRDPLASNADIEKATFSSMRRFCEPYYVPNNAVIAISGDFETAKARALVEHYFGSIKRGPSPARPAMRATLTTDRRLVLEDARATTTTLRLAWSGVGFANADRMALNALASVLQGDRSSGLVKTLVHDRKLATSVRVNHFDLESGGVFEIEVAPQGATPLGVIEDAVDSVLRSVRELAESERSLRRFKNANAFTATESLQARVPRAETLAQGEKWAGSPVGYVAHVSAGNRLTAADLRRVAAKYITPNRVVLSLVPSGKLELVSKPERAYENVTAAAFEGFTR